MSAAPLRILVDTREQRPLTFKHIIERKTPEGETVFRRIATETIKLPVADYSLPGHAGREGEIKGIGIERKNSIDELLMNLTKDRFRLTRELIELCTYRVALIVIEGCCADAINEHAYRSLVPPKTVWANLNSIEEKYRIPIRLEPDRAAAELCIVGTFDRYIKRLRDYERAGIDVMARKVETGDDETKPREIRAREWQESQMRLAVAESAVVSAVAMAEHLDGRLKALEAKEAG